MPQASPAATLAGMFPGYQPPVSPGQAANQGFQGVQASMPQTKFLPPGHVRPGMSGFTSSQAPPNALSAEHLPNIIQALSRR